MQKFSKFWYYLKITYKNLRKLSCRTGSVVQVEQMGEKKKAFRVWMGIAGGNRPLEIPRYE
jgi:hypothetical protein